FEFPSPLRAPCSVLRDFRFPISVLRFAALCTLCLCGELSNAFSIQSGENFAVAKFRSPIRMLHLERSRLAQNLVPYIERPADREPGIAGRGLDVHFFEWSLGEDLSVGNAVVGDAAGQAKLFDAVSVVQAVEHRMHGFFEPRLQRSGDVLMALL